METFTEWVRSIVVYLIVVSALLHVLPEAGYKKYVRLFTGLLLILIVIRPIGGIVSGNEQLLDRLYEQAVVWQESDERQRVIESIRQTEKESLLHSYEETLERQIGERLREEGEEASGIEVTLDETAQIRSISIVLPQSGQGEESEKKRQLVHLLADIYQLEDRRIEVRIGG